MISYNHLTMTWNRLAGWLTGRPFEVSLPISGTIQTIPFPKANTPTTTEETNKRQYERVAARRVGRGRYELLRSPNMVAGLAAGDVFVLAPKEECGFRVVARGSNLCVWFDFDARYDKDSPEAMELCRSVEALRGVVDGKGAFSLTFTIPSSAGLANIDDLLRQTAHRIPWSLYQYGSKVNEHAP